MDIKLLKVRLSFPSIFRARSFEEGKEPSFSAVLLLDKEEDEEQLKVLQSAINKLIKDSFDKKHHKKVVTCLHDGEEKEDLEGYGDETMFLNTRSYKRIPIVDRDRTPLTEVDGRPYAGCYVNVSGRLWVQDHPKWGKKVLCQLRAMQFVSDGEAFGDKPADPDEEFEDIEEDAGGLLD